MTRLVMTALFLLLAAPASAQWGSTESSSALSFAPDTVALDASERATATEQHRIGSGLVGAGLTLNLVGAAGALVGMIGIFSSSEDGACVRAGPCSAPQHSFDFGAFFASSIAVSVAGLVMFFVGLGLDVHAHVMRGRASREGPFVALSANGLSLSF